MSDETKAPTGEEGTPAPSQTGTDYVAKGEFNRKFSNVEETLKGITELLKSQLKPAQPIPQPEPEASDDISKVWYTDEKRAADMIVNKASKQAVKIMSDELTRNQRTQQKLQAVYNEFPETYQNDHPLTKRAFEVLESFDAEEKGSPTAVKAAIAQAAAELGIKPKSKRDKDSESNDSFSLGGGSPAPRKPKDGLAEETLEFAARMGLNVQDPKVVERLKSRTKR